MPLVSIIVPIYKVEPYLRECLDSVLRQTFQDFEMVLVDDGSPDKCPSICDEYADKDNRIIVIHKQNGGQGMARNAGIEYVFANSNCKYISFIDSDDYVESNFIEKMLDAIKGCDVSMCSFGIIKGYEYESVYSINSDLHLDEEGFWDLRIRESAKITPWNKLYRKHLFNDIRFPNVRFCEDGFIVHHIIGRCSDIHLIQDDLYHYRVRQDSTMKVLDLAGVDYNRLQVESQIDKTTYFYKKNNINQFVINQKREIKYFNLLYQNNKKIANSYFRTIKNHFIERKKLQKGIRDITFCEVISMVSPRLFLLIRSISKKLLFI